MNAKIVLILINLFISGFMLHAQNITNTPGIDGIFYIKYGSTTFMNLSRPEGKLSLTRNLTLDNTPGSQTGERFKV